MSDQTSETEISLLLKEQSDQGWRCLSFFFYILNTISGSPISTCSHLGVGIFRVNTVNDQFELVIQVKEFQ